MIYPAEDREICRALLRSAQARGEGATPLGRRIVSAGGRFLGAPYAPGTLEPFGEEVLVVNLRAFDCVTFVEGAVVLAGLIGAGETDPAAYAAGLERIRYRGGHCDGYISRLHYFTDWLHDNGRRGTVLNVTRGLGGIPFPKTFHHLTDRREEHPGLQDPAAFRRMRAVERNCSRRSLFFIPKADLARAESRLADGDVIAVTTDEQGLDVAHTGLCVHVGHEVRLLHASSAAGGVVLSEQSLAAYLQARRSRTGIIVGRACAAAPAAGRQGRPLPQSA